MGADSLLPSADLQGILRELAAEPGATALRIPYARAATAVLESRDVLRPFGTGLRAAERELVRVHRSELAFLLRQACVTRLYAHPEAKYRLIRHRTPTQVIEVLDERAWRARAREELAASRESAAELTGLDLIESCCRADGESRPSVVQLAAASLALHPTVQARVYQALELAFDGESAQADGLLDSVVSITTTGDIAAIAWNARAKIATDTGRDSEACAHWRRATETGPTLVVPWMARLAQALFLDRPDDAIAVGRSLSELMGTTSDAAIGFASMLHSQRDRKAWSVPTSRHAALRRAADKLAPSLRCIADALLE